MYFSYLKNNTDFSGKTQTIEKCPSNQNGDFLRYTNGEGRCDNGNTGVDMGEAGVMMGRQVRRWGDRWEDGRASVAITRQVWTQGRQAQPWLDVVRDGGFPFASQSKERL